MGLTKGKFIVFEGIDGCGKSTQMKMLGKYLAAQGREVLLTREPTESPFGATLRSCLTGRIRTDEHTIAAMFAADRLDHIFQEENGLLAKLNRGVTVLCDRYILSSLAYNGGFVREEWVRQLNAPALAALCPDLTLFIDASPEECMRRVLRRGETERYETTEKLTRIRSRYFQLFDSMPEMHVSVVASMENKEDTQAQLRALADALFASGGNGHA